MGTRMEECKPQMIAGLVTQAQLYQRLLRGNPTNRAAGRTSLRCRNQHDSHARVSQKFFQRWYKDLGLATRAPSAANAPNFPYRLSREIRYCLAACAARNCRRALVLSNRFEAKSHLRRRRRHVPGIGASKSSRASWRRDERRSGSPGCGVCMASKYREKDRASASSPRRSLNERYQQRAQKT